MENAEQSLFQPGLHPKLSCCCLLCCSVWKQYGSERCDALGWYQIFWVKCHAECEPQLWPVVSPLWSQLALAPSFLASHRSHPVLCYQSLPTQTQHVKLGKKKFFPVSTKEICVGVESLMASKFWKKKIVLNYFTSPLFWCFVFF